MARRAERGRLGALALALALGGCALNPATRRVELSLVSESDELTLGKEADAQVVAAAGVYEDMSLGAYVQGVGEAIARTSERPGLPWTFRVLDTPEVNAFALPGGYIYATRGLLAHLLAESELAAVFGHEVAHVSARHGVNQLSRTVLAQRGVGVFRVLDPNMRHVGAIAQGTAGLALLRHSREDEAEADRLALRYLRRAGQPPEAMARVLALLAGLAQQKDKGGAPEWLSTHPDPSARLAWVNGELGRSGDDVVIEPGFVARLEGLQVGEDPRHGMVVESTYYCPERGFQVTLPPGWKLAVDRTTMMGADPDEKALVIAGLARGKSLEEVEASFLGNQRIRPGRRWQGASPDYATRGGAFEFLGDDGVLAGLVVFAQLDGAVLVLLSAGAPADFAALSSAIDASFGTLAAIRDPAIRGVQPARLHVIEVQAATPLRELVPAAELGTTAAINRIAVDGVVTAGRPLKVIRRGGGA